MTRARLLLAAGVAVGTASAFAPMSSDEAAWLAIERRVAAGGTLYVDAIDNKSPFVFALVRGVDVLPGPYEPWRGVLLGVILVVAGLLAARALERLGCEQRTATAGGVLVAVSLPLASVLVLTIELPAALLAIAGVVLALSRPAAGGAVLALGTLFDPRVIALLPGLGWLAFRRGGARDAAMAIAGGFAVAGAWATIILLNDDLRFALVDLNVASRGAAVTDPIEQLAAALRAMIVPVVGVLVLARAGRRAHPPPVTAAGSLWAVLPAVGIVVASRHGFDHYWTLVIASLVFLIPALLTSPRMSGLVAGAFVALAAIAPLAHAGRLHAEQRGVIDRYERVAADLVASLELDEVFVQFIGDPYLAAELPERFAGRSPLLGYLVSEHARQDTYLRTIERDIDRASAIIEDGGLRVPREHVRPGYRTLYDVFRSSLDRFPCRRNISGVIIHYRRCAASAENG